MKIKKKSSELLWIWALLGTIMLTTTVLSYASDKKVQTNFSDLFKQKQNQMIEDLQRTIVTNSDFLEKIEYFIEPINKHYPYLKFEIHQGDAKETSAQIYTNHAPQAYTTSRRFKRLKNTQHMTAANKKWIIDLETAPQFGKEISRFRPVLIMLSGIALSITLFIILWIFRQSKQYSELVAAEKTHELVMANAELEEFAYRTSHDLCSPLKSAIGLLSVTEKSIHNKEQDTALKTLEMAISSLGKLENLVQDILVLTKAKNENEEITEIDTSHEIQDALDRLSNMENFERLNVQLELKYSDKLKTQKSRFVLIIENLISNAVKYQNLEEENSYLKISTGKANFAFSFCIEDNGLGIPKNLQEQLFTMFKRFHPKTSFGSGLGLYMIKKSANIIGADISFEDTGEGSKFKLLVPTDQTPHKNKRNT